MKMHPVRVSLMSAFCLTACVPRIQTADYGTKVTYKKGGTVTYPDFTLNYVGERQVSTSAYPRGFRYYDFHVIGGAIGAVLAGNMQTVSWSAGTGDIGPALFRVRGKQFALELSRSDKLGPLKQNEVVVSRVP